MAMDHQLEHVNNCMPHSAAVGRTDLTVNGPTPLGSCKGAASSPGRSTAVVAAAGAAVLSAERAVTGAAPATAGAVAAAADSLSCSLQGLELKTGGNINHKKMWHLDLNVIN